MDEENIHRLTEHVDAGTTFRVVPFFDTDVYDVDGLMQINHYVFGNE